MLDALAAVASTRCPRGAGGGAEAYLSGWSQIAADPEPFLGLGLVSREWLGVSLPALREHEDPPELAGPALLHFDVRSDNMCFTIDRALLVDWNWIGRGNPLFDVAAWLPSLHCEGGPAPEEVCPEAGVFAPALAVLRRSRATAHHPRRASCAPCAVRSADHSASPAARYLSLPPLDGPRTSQRD
jgi:hypothetical protein